MIRLRSKKAQHLTETALIIGLAILLFMNMEAYIRRGVQGNMKGLTDKMIGSAQEDYNIDVVGLSVSDATTNTALNQVAGSATLQGGAKQMRSVESTNITSNSHAEGSDSYETP